MKKNYTNKEQGSELISLGIPAENASLVWTTVDGYSTVVERDLCLPENIEGYAFTFDDMVSMFPDDVRIHGMYEPVQIRYKRGRWEGAVGNYSTWSNYNSGTALVWSMLCTLVDYKAKLKLRK